MVGHPSRLPARSRVQVCRAPSIRSHLLGLSPPCCSTDLESFSPLVSSDTFSFLFDHVRLPGHHFPSFFSSRLTALVSWKSFSGSPLCSLRTLSSLHSSGDRLAPRQPRSVTTVVPCLSNDMPTAGGSWTRTSRGKLAPGNHPEDTPSLRFHGAHGSVWVVAVVAVFPKTYAVAWIQTASIGKARIAPRITGEGHGNPLQSSRLETPMGGGAR